MVQAVVGFDFSDPDRLTGRGFVFLSSELVVYFLHMLISEEEFNEKLERMFERAGLNEEDRGLWRAKLADAGEYVRRMFIDVFSQDRDLLVFFTGNLRKRLAAQGDREKLDEIVNEEQAYFAGLMKSEE